MSDRTPPLDELLSFPCAFTFRVVALESPDLIERCERMVTEAIGRPLEGVQRSASRTGRYCTLRLKATVCEAEEITRAYGALSELDGLKMLL
jgi:putative lipoic acid-binding regulatory protein